MTLSAARAAAAMAIEAAAPSGVLWHGRVVESDGVRPSNLLALVRNMPAAGSRGRGDAGPATIVVTAPARDDAGGIEVEAFTVVKNRIADDKSPTPARGLAVLDTVEEALRGLPGADLPPLEPITEPTPLPTSLNADQVHVWRSRVVWPPAAGVAGAPATTGMQLVREAVAEVIEDALTLDPAVGAEAVRRGISEAEIREARWNQTLPRAEVSLRETSQTLTRATRSRYDDGSDEYDAQLAAMVVEVRIRVLAATEDAADALATAVLKGMTGKQVETPGSTISIARAKDYEPARYDSRAGALVATAVSDVTVLVEVSDPIQRATVTSLGVGSALLGPT